MFDKGNIQGLLPVILILVSGTPALSLPGGMEFTTIPAGEFLMGSPEYRGGRGADEGAHRVSLDAFEMMTTEVTQGMWREVMGRSPAGGRGTGDDHPVYLVSWNACQDFIEALNQSDTLYTYSLPSEAQWEYACRAGTETIHFWGDIDLPSTLGRYCWYSGNSDSTQPVAEKEPNAFGLYDMCGNVREWCQDVYTADYELCLADGTPMLEGGTTRVIRGGSFFFDSSQLRSAARSHRTPGLADYDLGFRLIRTPR